MVKKGQASICYTIDFFFNSGPKKVFASFNELLKKNQEAVLHATYGHLLDRAIYGQSHQVLQTAVKERGFASFDKLLKCCTQFSIFRQ